MNYHPIYLFAYYKLSRTILANTILGDNVKTAYSKNLILPPNLYKPIVICYKK